MSTFRQYFVSGVAVLLLVPASSYAQLVRYTVIHDLANDGSQGANPQSGLIRGADDRLYGAASEGGADGVGTIYRIGADGTSFEVIHTFSTTTPNGGLNPVSLMRGRDKNLYGTTSYGGTADDGVIYKLAWNSASATYSFDRVLHSFDCADPINQGGGDPWGAPTEGPDGALYGVTIPSDETDEDCTSVSTLYKVNKDGTGFRVLATFDYLKEGSDQFGSLVFGSDGSIYGTLVDTSGSAPAEYQDFVYGSIYRISPQGVITFKNFTNSAVAPIEGAYPYSGLIRGPGGALYGTTLGGGEFGVGTIFKINEDLTGFATLYSFSADCINTPYSGLVAGGDGVFYGLAHEGGTPAGCGVTTPDPFGYGGSYMFFPTGHPSGNVGFVVHKLFDHVTTGSYGYGPLGVAADRYLYGTMTEGGSGAVPGVAPGEGTLFGLGDLVDGSGNVVVSMKVVDRPPFPVALATPNPAEALPGQQGATIELSAQGSWDPDFDNLVYSWELPSGATVVTENPDHSIVFVTFPESPAGGWPVKLTVSNPPNEANPTGSPQEVEIRIFVIDSAPFFNGLPASVSTPATSIAGALVNYTLPTAMDLVDGDRSAFVQCNPAPGSQFPNGETTVTCRVSDLAVPAHTAEAMFVVTVTPALLIDVPGNMTVEATGPSGAAVSFTVSATSESGAEPFSCSTPSGPVVSGATFALGQTLVTCSAVNTITGLPVFASFMVTVQDTTAPAITMDVNGIEFNALGPFGAVIDYSSTAQVGMFAEDVPSANDLVDGNVAVVCNPPPGFTFPLGDANATRVTCTAVDSLGNSSEFVFYVIVRDGDFPVLTVPVGPIVAEATGLAGRQVTFATTATDITSPVGIVTTCSPSSGSTFALGATTVTCQAKDVSNHYSSDESFVITIVDTTPPAIANVPADITVSATSVAGIVVSYALPTALDIVNGVRTVACSPASGVTFPIGTTTVLCSVSDLNTPIPNTATATFKVIVRDAVPPVVTVPANIVAEASGPLGASVTFSATALDNRDGSLPVTCVPASGSLFPLFPIVTTVKCSATDLDGNVGASTFTVTVRDSTAPVLMTVAPIVAEATGPGGATVTFAPTAFDAVGVVGGVTCAPASGSLFPLFPIGPTTVNCNARDAAGNIGRASFTVTVRDTTAPVVAPLPDRTVSATGPTGAVVTFTPMASDLVGVVSLTCVPPSGSMFALGVAAVQCTAKDAAGNQGSDSFNVTVVATDLIAPVVTVAPPTLLAVAISPAGALGSFVATALDNVDGALPVTCIWPGKSVTFPRVGAVATSQMFPIGVTNVLCSATDARGNIGRATLIVTVIDGPPVVTVPANITINASASHTASVSFLASARDAVDGARSVTCKWGTAPNIKTLTFAAGSTVPQSGIFAEGSNLVTCSAVDRFGRSGSTTFAVVVTPPMTLGKFVVFSKLHTWLWARTRVLSGDVGANTKGTGFGWHDDDRDDEEDEDDRFRFGAIEVRLGQAATMPNGSRVIGDTVWLQPHTSVYDVIDNNLIRLGATVHGTVTTGLTLPLMNLPALPANSPGTKDVVVGKNKTVTLSPGRYRNITVDESGTLVLTGGLYQVQSLELGTRSKVRVMATVDMRIRGEFSAGSYVTINEPLSAVPARQVLFSVGGTDSSCRHGSSHHGHDHDDDDHGDHDEAGPTTVHIGTYSTIKANIYAPGGTVWIQSKANATGAFIGERVRIGIDSQLTLDSAF